VSEQTFTLEQLCGVTRIEWTPLRCVMRCDDCGAEWTVDVVHGTPLSIVEACAKSEVHPSAYVDRIIIRPMPGEREKVREFPK
jgi:hypothetical protein